ncbi:MAG: hypothetical protein AAF600_20860 [Bacteroidota bacterium]
MKFNFKEGQESIDEFIEFTNKRNVKGLKLKSVSKPSKTGSLGGEVTDAIQVILATSGAGISLKGLFDLLKGYFVDLKKVEIEKNANKRAQELSAKAGLLEKIIENNPREILLENDNKKLNIAIDEIDLVKVEELLSILEEK